MTRRISALLGMAAIVALLLLLIWQVYLHHRSRVPSDEPTVVQLGYCSPKSLL